MDNVEKMLAGCVTVFLTALVLLISCVAWAIIQEPTQKPTTVEVETPMRHIDTQNGIAVYLVSVEGSEYVVFKTKHGVATCPKTQK